MLRLLGDGLFSECYATDNGTALVFAGTDFVEAVTERDGAFAWHLRRDDTGRVVEQRLPTRLLT